MRCRVGGIVMDMAVTIQTSRELEWFRIRETANEYDCEKQRDQQSKEDGRVRAI